jgi:hypothetical protein
MKMAAVARAMAPIPPPTTPPMMDALGRVVRSDAATGEEMPSLDTAWAVDWAAGVVLLLLLLPLLDWLADWAVGEGVVVCVSINVAM